MQEMNRTEKQLAWGAWTAYVLVLSVGLARGGMWLDEMQVWCIGRDHHSLIDLLRGLRNEGHPPLWFVLVHALTRITSAPAAMALLHGACAAGTAWIILFRAPWPMLWRMLAVCGYFFLFEYAVVARNYGPAAFFLFLALATHRQQRPWATMLALMALALTHYWGMAVAASWALSSWATSGTDRAERRRLLAVLAVVAASFMLAWPSAPLPYRPSLAAVQLHQLPEQVGGILLQTFMPLPDLNAERLWNTNWLLAHHPQGAMLLGLACGLLALWTLMGARRWLVFVVLAWAAVLAFPLLAPFQGTRYYGPLWLTLLAAWWMAPPVKYRTGRLIALACLLLQVPGALVMTEVTWSMPRSMAERFVHWRATSVYAQLPVLAHPYQEVPALSGYLGHAVWCPATGSMESWCRWTFAPFRLEKKELVEALHRAPWPEALLVTDDAGLEQCAAGDLHLEEVNTFPEAQIGSESYHVYHLVKPRP
jgi:hypothetical protein